MNEKVEKDVYAVLGIVRADFVEMLRSGLESGVTTEYSAKIAELIADRVAEDVKGTADPSEWNTCDVALGIGRVLLECAGREGEKEGDMTGGGTRNGKHRPEKTMCGAYITPEDRALFELTGKALHMTMTEIILEGMRILATKAGVLVNDQVSPAFADRYAQRLDELRKRRAEKPS